MITRTIDAVSDWFKKDKDASATKQDIIQHLGVLSTRTKNFIDLYDSKKDLFTQMTSIMNDNRIYTDRYYIQYYFTFTKNLVPRAAKMEQMTAFSTLAETMKAISTVIVELKSNIDKYIGDAEINRHNMKISHVGVLNFMKIAETICNFTYFLFNGVAKEISTTYQSDVAKNILPKYRTLYIEKNIVPVAATVNKHTNYNVFKDVLTALKELQKEGKDMYINNTSDGGSNGELAGVVLRSNPLVLTDIIGFDNVFLMIGKAYHNIVHWWYVRMQKEKEWMEARVALIRLELNNVDPNSDEYLKLAQIADNYDLMITDSDSKLNKYFTD